MGTTIAGLESMEQIQMDARSLAEIVSDLKRDLTTLVREELSLARVEITEKSKRLRRGAVSLVVGGVIAFAGLLSLVAAVILGLDQALHAPWLSSAIIGAILSMTGLVCMSAARKHFEGLAPRETVESLRRSKELIENQVTAGNGDLSR